MSTTRPGGRAAIVKAKALEAAQVLAIQRGLHNVTMPDIARLSGIAPTSLYRRWGDIGSLLMEMAVDRLNVTFPLPDEGSVRADLTIWAQRIVDGLNKDTEVNFFRVLLATIGASPEGRKAALAPRLEQLDAVLARAVARGESVPPLEEAIDHLLAPLYMRSLLSMPLDKHYAEELIRRLLG